MVIVVEPLVSGSEHVAFNAALIEVVRLACPGQDVRFCAERSHIDEVRRQLGTLEGVSYREIEVPPRRAPFFDRLLGDYRSIRAAAAEDTADGVTAMVFASALESTIVALKWHALWRRNRLPRRVHVVLHGVLADVWGWQARNPFIRWRQLRSVLSMPSNSDITYLVLEESIQRELLGAMPNLLGSVSVLPHPIRCPELTSSVGCRLSLPVKFVFLGLASEPKGFLDFLRVARVARETLGERAEFHAVGRQGMEGSHPDLGCLTTVPALRQVERSAYLHALSQMHFVCWPCKPERYRYTSSGVLLDAMASGKPVIGTDIPTLRDTFASSGDGGYLCRDLEDMTSTVCTIVSQLDEDRYMAQSVNIASAGALRRVPAVAAAYARLLNTGH